MSDKLVNAEDPTIGQTSDTYNDGAFRLVSVLRDNGNRTLGAILTLIEAALGDTKQAEALKSTVRKEIFMMIDRNQGEIYERAGMQRKGLKPKAYTEFKDDDGKFESFSIEQ